MAHKSINSPFRYPGGKFYARKLILKHLPPHTHYIEPFAGGGSIFFAKEKVLFNQLNDKDENLINVYEVIRNTPEKLIDFLTINKKSLSFLPSELIEGEEINAPIPAKKELHTFFKKNYQPNNPLEKAGRWFYLNRTSYSGIMNTKNMYWGYGAKYSMQPKNWPANIRRTHRKLQNAQLTQFDFEEVIDNAPDNALLFIAPPYFNADQDKFYTCSFSKDDHFRLEKCLKRNNHRLQLFITYDNTNEIRELYDWMTEMHDKEWNYCIQRTDDQKNGTSKKGSRYKGKELFILNFTTLKEEEQTLSPQQALLDLPLMNTEKKVVDLTL